MMSHDLHAKLAKPMKASEVSRLLYIASACRLWLREHTALRHQRSRPSTPGSRWDWSSQGSPVMR
jgi:hypothetical protein